MLSPTVCRLVRRNEVQERVAVDYGNQHSKPEGYVTMGGIQLTGGRDDVVDWCHKLVEKRLFTEIQRRVNKILMLSVRRPSSSVTTSLESMGGASASDMSLMADIADVGVVNPGHDIECDQQN